MPSSEPKNTRAPGVADDPRWRRVLDRDPSADGLFWCGVTTTGVYCRPSCPSRTALPEHVRFFDTLELARTGGFRPCRRCHPDGLSIAQLNAQRIAEACRLLDHDERSWTTTALAQAVGLSDSHFHRLFTSATGLTPKAYGDGRRAARLRQGLGKHRTVTEAIYEAGFGSSGRFYETSAKVLGMTPSHYRSGGPGETLRFALGHTSLGALLVASSDRGVAAILLGDDPGVLLRSLQDRFPKAELIGADAAYEALVAQVVGFVEAPRRGLDLPLDIRGTAFQERVWRALLDIPVGQTVSYSEIARRVGAPRATRAVAEACASNNLAVAIPCHRVVKTDGSFWGYTWGLERKQTLLDREAIAP